MCEICAATATFVPERHPDIGPLPGLAAQVLASIGLNENGTKATITEVSDAPWSLSTSYSIAVGDSFVGDLSNGSDRDLVRIELQAGTTYTINLTSEGLPDPKLYVYDASGTPLMFNEDGGPGNDSVIYLNVHESGSYYLGALSDDGSGGRYSISVDIGDNPAPAPTASLSELADYLTHGYWQDTGRSQRSFDTSTSNVITVDLSALTSEGAQLARWALDAWSMVADLVFREVSANAQITFDDDESGAFASSRILGNRILSSEINVSEAWLSTYGTTIDSYALQVYIHEIGHSLGLGHQGSYNGTGSFGSDETFYNDSWAMSVMSYFSQRENYSADASYGFAIGPMMADIVAIQNLYGAPITGGPTGGDTVWGANNSLSGHWGIVQSTLFENAASSVVGDSDVVFTIYDQGGNDLINLSSIAANNELSLVDGSFSNINGGRKNMAIADGTQIENAVTGDGDDTIYGNEIANDVISGDGHDLVFGNGGHDQLDGGPGDDRVWGGQGNDTVMGSAGDDTIGGSFGNDLLLGGTGHDEMWANQGQDELQGGEGNDTVGGGSEDDILYGNAGNDQAWGGGGQDLVYGGSGDDTIGGREGNDSLYGGDGNDVIWANEGNDILSGGDGADILGGSAGNDTIHGEMGQDDLRGSDGNDSLLGGGGDDTIDGSSGNDRAFGGSGADLIYGGFGDDFIEGDSGGDQLWGGLGRDTIFGEGGNDVIGGADGDDELHGGSGNDEIWANQGSDTIFGGAGDDILGGGYGDDQIWAGAGTDVIFGGGGADQFHFAPNEDTSRVNDFEDHDLIFLHTNNLSFGDLEIAETGPDLAIYFLGTEITLADTDFAAIDADHFVFV